MSVPLTASSIGTRAGGREPGSPRAQMAGRLVIAGDRREDRHLALAALEVVGAAPEESARRGRWVDRAARFSAQPDACTASRRTDDRYGGDQRPRIRVRGGIEDRVSRARLHD